MGSYRKAQTTLASPRGNSDEESGEEPGSPDKFRETKGRKSPDMTGKNSSF